MKGLLTRLRSAFPSAPRATLRVAAPLCALPRHSARCRATLRVALF